MFLLKSLSSAFGLLLLTIFSLEAQYNQYRIYTSNDGLPQSETVFAYVSEDGALWTQGTSGDLCRFDGRVFDCQLLSDLKLNGYVGNIFEHNSRLWLETRGNKSIYLERGQWFYPNSEEKLVGMGIHSNGNVVACNEKGEFLGFDEGSMRWKVISEAQIQMGDSIKFIDFKIGKHFLAPLVVGRSEGGAQYTWALEDMESGQLSLMLEGRESIQYWDEDLTVIQKKDEVFELHEQNKKVMEFKGYGTSLSRYFISGKLYFGLHELNENEDKIGFQLYHLKKNRTLERVLHIPLSSRITDIEQDLQGNFWLTSHEGLIRCNPHVLYCSQNQKGMVSALHAISEDQDGRIWFGGYGDGLCYFDGERIQRPEEGFQALDEILPDSYRDKQGTFFFWEETHGLVQIKKDGWISCPQPEHTDSKILKGYFFRQLENNKIALGLSKVGLGLTDLPLEEGANWKLIGKEKGLELGNVLTISEDQKGRLWCGRPSFGLALYDPHLDTAHTWKNNDHPSSPFKVLSSTIDKRGHLWLGCHDGLKLIRNPDQVKWNDSTLHEKIEKIDLGTIKYDKVKGLLIYENYLVISGQNGHAFMDLNSFYTQEKPDLFFFDTSDPAQGGAGEQNALYKDSKGYLWIGKDLGALRIDMEKLVFDTLPVSIVIDEITAGNEKVALGDGDLLQLPTKKRSLQLDVHQSFSGYLNDNVDFRYRLKKRNEKTGSFIDVPESGSIRIDYLAPGSYTLDFEAIKNNQITDTRTLSLEVPFLLVETPLFWMGLIGFFFLGVFIILYFQYQSKYKIKQSELQLSKLEGELDQMQVKAISSALNPHFINNALHWLQSKMRSDKEAMLMIDRISENIRMVFTRSRQGTPFHALKEELNLVRNYVYVQQIRYGDELECEMPSPASLQHLASIQLPLMQIQIHMENAIEHGLRNRMGKGWVKLSIDEKPNHILIRIADNGVGRAQARALGSGGTQQGVAMLENLHRIYNQKNKNQIEFWYKDLPFVDHKTGEKVGTITHILIPKEFHYALTPT